MERTSITIDFKETELVGDILPADSVPDVLLLHGAGTSNRFRYDYLRLPLAKDGIATCGFDFVGHGETGGELQQSSLAERTDQAATVIDTLAMPQPLGLIGASMGAYTAIRLLQSFEVDRLVLLVPGIYRDDVYDISFDRDEFTNKIHKPQSWEQSDAWEILNTYTGKLLIVAAENDGVVPREIVDRIYDEARNASERHIHVIPGATHQIREFLVDPANEEEFQKYYQLIKQVLS